MCKPGGDTGVAAAAAAAAATATSTDNVTPHPPTTTISTKDMKELNKDDIDRPRNEYIFGLPPTISKWVVRNMLKNEQSEHLTIFYVMVNVMVTTVPAACLLFYLDGHQSLIDKTLLKLLGTLYVVLNLKTFARSFILALHYSTHTPIFNQRWRLLNYMNATVLCNLFGMPLLTYYAHHVAMHHRENNVIPHDVSSTMPYRRDSKLDHFKYMLRYLLFIWFELPYHLIIMERPKIAASCVTGIILFFGSIFKLYQVWPVATFFVFILPTIVVSFALMEGNWKQHIFVDPNDPLNFYKSTFTCINNTTNALNFNDGYHVEHHKNPSIAWYDLPVYFQKQIPFYVEHDAIIFSGVSSGQVGTMVLNGKLEQLADHYVNVGQKVRTKSELVEEFKRRLQPVYSMEIKTE
mmetsp:Transcript_15322/g.37908  ORF Transcript_15322/g.37908 Transcript_15322/m.37908 type:complete len:406 (-) Transcript_15322:3178-4395(-)